MKIGILGIKDSQTCRKIQHKNRNRKSIAATKENSDLVLVSVRWKELLHNVTIR